MFGTVCRLHPHAVCEYSTTYGDGPCMGAAVLPKAGMVCRPSWLSPCSPQAPGRLAAKQVARGDWVPATHRRCSPTLSHCLPSVILRPCPLSALLSNKTRRPFRYYGPCPRGRPSFFLSASLFYFYHPEPYLARSPPHFLSHLPTHTHTDLLPHTLPHSTHFYHLPSTYLSNLSHLSIYSEYLISFLPTSDEPHITIFYQFSHLQERKGQTLKYKPTI